MLKQLQGQYNACTLPDQATAYSIKHQSIHRYRINSNMHVTGYSNKRQRQSVIIHHHH
jgi:hypothetical protein